MSHRCRLALLAAVVVTAAGAAAAQSAVPSRGQTLYELHCIGCHTTQMHWRANRRATDWATLRDQVQRWQATAQLNWHAEDIDEVARHLNDTIYRFERPPRPIAGVAPPAAR